MEDFDFIIIGAGSAGCVIANRLSRDPSVRVVVIEAGPTDMGFPMNVKSRLPVGNIFLLPQARYNWQYEFTGGSGVNGRTIPCPRGKMLGGCSSVNGTVYMRGSRRDYDEWASLGNEGWSYTDVLQAYKQQENWRGPDSQFHGHGGELDVQAPRSLNPLSVAFCEAAIAAGHRANDDFNGASQDGFGGWELNQRDGIRLSSSRAFLHPVLERPNLTVMTDTMVNRINVEGDRATGVTITRGGEVRALRAAREIILSGGAINSPHLLMVSGIGPASHLRAHGIEVVRDLPGVGENLQDHPSAVITMADPSLQSYALTWRSLPRIALSPLKYLISRSGMLASNAAESGGFIHTRAGLDAPDVQLTFMPGLKSSAKVLPRDHGVMAFVTLLRPAARGTVRLASPDPLDQPVLDPRFLEDDQDVATLIRGLKETRRILAHEPIASLLGVEMSPGPLVQSDEELEAALRQTLITIYHPVGTCKMGPLTDPLAVVDNRLQVHGITGLRVADASIMPTIIGGNTSAPAMMIGERAAGFALEAMEHRRAAA